MRQTLAERWRLMALVGPLIAVALGALGQITSDDPPAEAATGGPEMVLNVVGGSCDDLVRPTECDVALGAQFTLAVIALDIPTEGYVYAGTFIRFGPDLVYAPTAEPHDEVRWPDCLPGNLARFQGDATSTDPFWGLQNVAHGCASSVDEDALPSYYVGTMTEILLVCTSVDSSSLVQLLPEGHPVASTLGAAFVGPNHQTITPKVSNVQINCGAGGPLDTPTPTHTSEPTATPTATEGPPLKGNDDFAAAFVVNAPLPYTNEQDIRDASIEALEPEPCNRLGESVWFSYTPANDAILSASVEGGVSVLAVYTGASLGTLANLACRVGNESLVRVTFSAIAGELYYVQVGFRTGVDPSFRSSSVVFRLAEEEPPPKGNDEFANAISITDPLPYSNKQDVGGALLEVGDPTNCGLTSSVWYTYIPSEDIILSFDTSASDFTTKVAAYAGTTLSSLDAVSCGEDIVGKADTTYYFQLGSGENGASGNLSFEFTAITCRVEGCPNVVLNVAGGTCDAPVAPSTCDVASGEKFSLLVNILGAPPQGYILMQSYIVLSSDLAYDINSASVQEEVVWQDCSIAIKAPLGAQSFIHGCLTGLVPPLTSSDYLGTFVALSVTCSSAASSTEVQLLDVNDPLAETNGTVFSLDDGSQLIPDVDNLTVNCVGSPPAVGGIALGGGLDPLPALDSELLSFALVWWLVAGLAATSFALAVGAAATFALKRQ